jgi:hypothetical protein
MAVSSPSGRAVPSVSGKRRRRIAAITRPGRELKTRGGKIRRFEFAIDEGSRKQAHEKKRREVADYVLGWLECADIVDEVAQEDRRVLIVEVWCGVQAEKAESFCSACPHYVAGSFGFD